MVAPSYPQPDNHDTEAAYEELHEYWPERASRKRAYRRKEHRRIVVKAERLDPTDASRVSKALLAAQRELARAAAEARAEEDARESRDD